MRAFVMEYPNSNCHRNYDYYYFSDIRRMNSQAVYAKNTGMIILGGGLVKHHICNANLMVIHLLITRYNRIDFNFKMESKRLEKIRETERDCIDGFYAAEMRSYLHYFKLSLNLLSQRNGADFSLFVNTASEFDGSDSGARPDEAISWGKIKKTAKPVKVRTSYEKSVTFLLCLPLKWYILILCIFLTLALVGTCMVIS